MKEILKNVNVKNLKLDEICRFCLAKDGILLSIFGFQEGSKLFELPFQLKTILSVELEKEDGLPSLICHSCLYKVEQSIDFKKQCEKADTILRIHLQSHNEEISSETSLDCKSPISPKNARLWIEHENGDHLAKDSACQANTWEPDVSLEAGNNVADDSARENSESNDAVVKEEFTQIDHSETEDFSHLDQTGIEDFSQLNQGEMEDNQTEIEEADSCENALQIEEKMNELEEERFASEPFSLDLCSVRLRCEQGTESDLYTAPAPQLLPPPATQLTDDDQWTDSNSEASEEMEVSQTQAGSCNCPMCNKAFTSHTDLQRHQLIHKQEPPYPCDYCDQDFEEKMLLKAHWRKHAMNRPHLCLTCGEAFMERWQLVKHFTVHDRIKPYHCSGCGKAFAYRSDLRKHAIIHTGVRPFKCPVCGKTFTRSTNLNKHARLHSGRRPYPCEHCDKMFSSRGDLVRHAVIHTGEKPYACLICSLAFNRKDKLIRHERVHATDRPFACAECPSSFHRKEELTKHIRFNHFKPDPEYFMSLE